MTDSQVLSGLVAKRNELAREMEVHRRELERQAAALSHVEATIRLFDPSYEFEGTPTCKRGSRQQLFRPGECQRLVLEVLRDAVAPVTAHALAREVSARKGLGERRDRLLVVQKTALAVLRRLVSKGVVRRQTLADGSQVWERG